MNAEFVVKYPLVSVVIPCFNAANYIGRCLEHLSRQKYSNLEVICIDDGSSDETVDHLRQYAAASPLRIQIATGANQGAPAARNKGLAMATGEYIQFLDADDVLQPDKIQHQVQLATADSGSADLVAGAYVRLLPSGERRPHPVEMHDLWIGLLRGHLGITSANLWKTETVRSIGGWDTAWPASQDAEITFRMLRAGAVVCIDDSALTIKEELPSGINASNRARQLRCLLESRRMMLTHMRNDGLLSDRERQIDYDWMFRHLMSYYDHDRSRAIELHKSIFPSWFVPARTVARRPQLPRVYQIAYRVMGFDKAQRLNHGMKTAGKVLRRIRSRLATHSYQLIKR